MTSTTDRARCTFRVTTQTDGSPFVVYDVTDKNLPALRGFLSFDLKPGTSLEEARRLVDRMNDAIVSLAHTY